MIIANLFEIFHESVEKEPLLITYSTTAAIIHVNDMRLPKNNGDSVSRNINENMYSNQLDMTTPIENEAGNTTNNIGNFFTGVSMHKPSGLSK